jgi:hypothetical protein
MGHINIKTLYTDPSNPDFGKDQKDDGKAPAVGKDGKPVPKKPTPPKPEIIELTIVDAKFLKDIETFSKQDPYIKWKFLGNEMKTSTKDDAGKEATWDEKRVLVDIQKAIKAKETLILHAMDSEMTIDATIGTAKPIYYQNLMKEGLQKQKVLIFDKKNKEIGHINIKTEYKNPNPKTGAPPPQQPAG